MKQKEEYLVELEFIKSWNTTVLDFMSTKIPELKDFSEITKQSLSSYSGKVNKNVLLGFRSSYRDINEMAKNLSPLDYEELNKLLLAKFHLDFTDIDQRINSKIASVVLLGRIDNEEEYKMIEDKVNELCQNKEKNPTIDALNTLLLSYEQSSYNK
ncbi:hypothetical protein [Pedobacter africanus]|uniref:Uncharacterized protein n=1 Tax=Pedobacter africanus TaxID=151894 RepID=A0A1W2BPF8_9SPHI|nr:hypothetical protein [Pedobacter africanus]SMC74845.1 hypothetical protein SAMN04488524_2536 [Pedobacter africanus]